MLSELRQRAQSAVFWNTSFAFFRDLLQFFTMLILVRLLQPEAYGQFGLLNNIIGFIVVFSFRPFISHTLQVARDEDTLYQEHFTAGAVIQLFIFCITNLVALVLSGSDTYSKIAPVLHVMSLIFLFDLPCELRIKMLERNMDWRRIRLLNGIAMLVGQGMAIGLAFAGAGVYALVTPIFLVSIIFTYDLFFIQNWHPNWSWDSKRYGPAWHFGLTRIGSGIIGCGRQLMEGSLLVHGVGYTNFGFYGRAVGVSQIFCYRFAFLLMQAIYAALTRIRPNKEAYIRANELIIRGVAWIVIPIGLIFAVLAAPIVKIVYGSKWLEVIPLLPWAMAVGVAGAISHVSYMLLLSNQKQKRCVLYDILILIGTGACLMWILPHGMDMYLFGLTGIHVFGLMLLFIWLYRDQAITLNSIISTFLPPLVAVICAFIVCEGLRHYLSMEIQRFSIALGYGVAFSVVYLGVLRLLFGSKLSELVSNFPGGNFLNRLLLL